ncbi:MAG TPA: histidine phosphatase family protein [Candidatus Paceibacterota bacterium]|jgi:broad specificity phosphatase PhoE
MKTVYFVRHGQSRGNASLITQQTETTELTARGRLQAEEVARHLQRIPLEAVIASTFARARSTAEEIGRGLGLRVEHSPLFIERRRPGVQIRKRKVHPNWLWTQLQLVLYSSRADYRHSDEETAQDLLTRAHQALTLLELRTESTICVVTHAEFMRALHTVITYGEGVTGKVYLGATRHMRLKNTALMIADHEDDTWKVRIWNADAKEL